MNFGHIEIFVSDLRRSARFYQDVLGFELADDQGDMLWLACGDVEFLLRQGGPPEAAARYEEAASGIVLYTDDLEAEAARLSKRGLEFRGTVDTEKCLTFSDPDGNWFQLVDPGNF